MVRTHGGVSEDGGGGAMNPLDWSLIAGPLPVVLLAGALLALAWLAAGKS